MLPPRIRRAFRLAIRRRDRVEAETDEEIRFHLAMRVERLVAGGMPRTDAEGEALRRFGALDEARPQLLAAARQREERLTMIERLDALRDDARYALRQLRRAPGLTAALTLTFALGIGANATMFEVVDRLLLRPPAFLIDAERTGRVYLHRPLSDGTQRIDNNISYFRYAQLRDGTRSFDAAAAFYQDELVVGTGLEAGLLRVGLVSASFWPMFEVRPQLGRFFGVEEDRPPGGSRVAVLGHGFWVSRFGGDSAVLGRELRIGGATYTIIGVAPRGFHGVWPSSTAAYIPITAGANDLLGSERYALEHNAYWLEMMARRRPGVSVEAANAELTRAFRRSRAEEVAAARPGATIRPQVLALTSGELAPLLFDRGPKASQSARVAVWLAGVSAIVLLIACANVANLLLARAIRRRREVAVRVALGVGRGRLVSQMLTESVLLALVGGVAGLLLARWGGGTLRELLLPDVDWSAVPAFDGRVLLFTAGAALLTGLVTGLAPIFHAMRSDLRGALGAGDRDGGAHRSRLRGGLLLVQATLSVVLLVGAGLFVRSLRNVETLDLGWDAQRLLHVRADARGLGMPATERRALYQRLLERARTLPGVTHAATTVGVPFRQTVTESVFVPGMDSASMVTAYVMIAVSDDYFPATGTRIIRGRAVGDADRDNGPRVAVVSASMAGLLWKGRNPIGECFRVGADTAPCTEVVGVAEDVAFGDLRADEGIQFYVPTAQAEPPGGLYVRAAGEARRIAEPVRRELQQLVPGMVFIDLRPMESILDSSIHPWRLGAAMFTIFGLLALALAAIGLYGVVAYNVAQRMHEMGIRVALGARSRDIRRLVLTQGLTVAALGAVFGALLAFAAGRYIEGLLFETSPHDPLVFGAAVVVILVVAAAASLIPAARATRVDPVVALRSE